MTKRTIPIYVKTYPEVVEKLEKLARLIGKDKVTALELLIVRGKPLLPCDFSGAFNCTVFCKRTNSFHNVDECLECNIRSCKWWGQQ